MAGINFNINGDSSGFQRALNEATSGVKQAKAQIESSGQSMAGVFNSLKSAAMGMGLAFGLNELKNLGVQIASTRGQFQQLEMSFKTMLGSGEKATAMMKQLTTIAATTPFGLSDVASGAKSLLAYGIEAEKVNNMLVRLGNIASGLSIPLNDLIYLYGTTMAQGRMFTQDLRQFQGRGIPMADELAKIFGIAKSQVGEFVTAGKVGAKEVEQAIINMTSSGSKFGGLMEAQSKTITGRWSNIQDQIDMAFNEMGQGSEGVINGILDSIAFLVEHYKEIGKGIGAIIASYGAWKTTMMAMNVMNKSLAADEQEKIAQITAAYDAELQKLRELQEAKKEANQAPTVDVETSDIDKAVSTGAITQEQGNEIATYRTLAAEKLQAAEAALVNASAVEKEKASIVESALATAEAAKEQEDFLKEKLEWLDEQISLAEEAGDADEYVSLMTEREAVAEQLASASTEANTATKQLNIAATELDAATTQRQTAVRNLATASEEANTVATASNTSAQVANTTSTKAGTLADKAAVLGKRALATATGLASKAFNGLKAAFLSNPIGMIAMAVVGVITAISSWKDKQEELNKTITEGAQKAKDYYSSLEQEGSQIESLVKTIRDKNANSLDQIKAYRDLIALVPELTNQYSQQELAALSAADAENLLTQAIRNRELAKSQKDIETAQSALASLESGKAWDELKAEERKFLKETMAFESDTDPDNMKAGLRGFIPEAKQARQSMIDLNKASDLKNMKSGEKKVKAITAELDNLNARESKIDEVEQALQQLATAKVTWEDSYGAKLSALNPTEYLSQNKEFFERLSQESGLDFSAFAKTLTNDAEKNMTKVRAFMDTNFAETRRSIEANTKMLGDELKVEMGVEVAPKIETMNLEEAKKALEKNEQELNDELRLKEQIKELEQTVILNANIKTLDAQHAYTTALNQLDSYAQTLGQDRYISTDMTFNVSVNRTFNWGKDTNNTNIPTIDLTTGQWTYPNMAPTANVANTTLQQKEAENQQLKQRVQTLEEQARNRTVASSKNKGKGKKGKTQAELNAEYEKAVEERKKTETEVADERKEQATEIENEIAQLKIDLYKSGEDKYCEQVKLDNKKEREDWEKQKNAAIKAEIERQKELFEAREAERKAEAAKNKKKYTEKTFTDADIDQTKINEIIDQYDALWALRQKTNEAQLLSERIANRNSYLEQYGNAYAKELAITQDYEAKIAEAKAKGDDGQVAILEEERSQKIASAQINEVVAKIDWVTALDGGLSSAFKGILEPLYKQLSEYSKSEAFSKLDQTNQQAIVNAMNNLTGVIGTSALDWKDLRDALVNLQIAENNLANAITKQQGAQTKLTEAQNKRKNAKTEDEIATADAEVNQAQQEYLVATQEVTDASKALSGAQQNTAQTARAVSKPMDKIGLFLEESGIPQLGELWNAFLKLKGALNVIKGVSEAGQKIQDGTDEIAEATSDGANAISKTAGKLSDSLGKAGGYAALIGAILQILDILKDGIGKLIADVLSTVLNAISGILHDILSGKFIGIIWDALLDGLGNIVDAITRALGNILTFGALDGGLTDWFTNSNAKEVKETIDRLTDRNEILTKSVDQLTEEMGKARGAMSVMDYKRAYEAQEELTDNYKEIAKAQASYHGAHHSWEYYWEGFTDEQIARLREQIGNSDWTGDIWDLTAEEMANVLADPEIREMIRDTGEGDYGERLLEKLDEYADQAGKLDDLTSSLYETLTGMSFESMYDSFVDALMDMEYSAEDAADNMAEYFMKAMISNKIGEMFYDELEEWYQTFGEYMTDGGLNDAERAQLKDWYLDMTERAISERDAIADVVGYEGETEDESSSASRGIESMTQEEASELTGRFTALQIAGEAIRSNTTSINGLIQTMLGQLAPSISASEDASTTLLEIRELAIQRNGYLSDISDYTKNLIAIKKSLSQIVTNTNNI